MSPEKTRDRRYKYKINPFFFGKWTKSMAWALGLVYSDGNINSRKNWKHYRLKLFSKDKILLKRFQKALSSTHPIFPVKDKRFPKAIGYEFSIANKEIYNSLLSLGVTPNKSLTITFPRVPEKYLSHFIRGIFDGDGGVGMGVRQKPQLKVTTGSLIFAKKLTEIFRERGFPSSYHKTSSNCYLVVCSARAWLWLYKNKGIWYLPRKYNLVKKRGGFNKIKALHRKGVEYHFA